jgi:hypothetical protein
VASSGTCPSCRNGRVEIHRAGVGAILATETELDEELIDRASTAASQDRASDIVHCVEVVRFKVMEELYGPEDEHVRLWPGKLRDFAYGDYPPPEIAGLD